MLISNKLFQNILKIRLNLTLNIKIINRKKIMNSMMIKILKMKKKNKKLYLIRNYKN